jgi:hypothetical protein
MRSRTSGPGSGHQARLTSAEFRSEGGGYTGAISCGFDRKGNRLRIKRKGRTKAQVKDKLREVVDDLEAGVAAGLGYTVRDAVDDFFGKGSRESVSRRSPTTGRWPTGTSFRRLGRSS